MAYLPPIVPGKPVSQPQGNTPVKTTKFVPQGNYIPPMPKSNNPGYVAPKPQPVKQAPKPQPQQNFIQQAENAGQTIGAGVGVLSQAIKGIFTPAGGKPQPVKQPPPPTVTITPQQKASIATIKPGQILPDFSPSQVSGMSPTLQGQTPINKTKNHAVVKPNIIDTFLKDNPTIAEPIREATTPITQGADAVGQLISNIWNPIKQNPTMRKVVDGALTYFTPAARLQLSQVPTINEKLPHGNGWSVTGKRSSEGMFGSKITVPTDTNNPLDDRKVAVHELLHATVNARGARGIDWQSFMKDYSDATLQDPDFEKHMIPFVKAETSSYQRPNTTIPPEELFAEAGAYYKGHIFDTPLGKYYNGILNNPNQKPSLVNQAISGVEKALPDTASTIKSIVQDVWNLGAKPTPLAKDIVQTVSKPGAQTPANIKKTMTDLWTVIKPTIDQEQKNIQSIFTAKTPVARVAAGTQTIAGAGNVVFSPISALFGATESVPILGTVAKIITLPFALAGDAGKDYADQRLSQMHLPPQALAQIKPGVEAMYQIGAQLVAGHLGDMAGVKEDLTNKFGEKDAQTIIDQAQRMEQSYNKGVVQRVTSGKASSQEINQYQTLAKAGRLREFTEAGHAGFLAENAGVGTMEFTPEQAQGAIVGSDLENTPAGNAIIKESLNAKQTGQNVEVTIAKGHEGEMKTPGGVTITNVQSVEPSTAATRVQSGKPIEEEPVSENKTPSVPTGNPKTLTLTTPENFPGIREATAAITPDNVGSINVQMSQETTGMPAEREAVQQLESQLQAKGVPTVHVTIPTEAVPLWKELGYIPVQGGTLTDGRISMTKELSPLHPETGAPTREITVGDITTSLQQGIKDSTTQEETKKLSQIAEKLNNPQREIEPEAQGILQQFSRTPFNHIEAFTHALSEKYGGEFTTLYDKIQSGQIDKTIYEQAQKYYTESKNATQAGKGTGIGIPAKDSESGIQATENNSESTGGKAGESQLTQSPQSQLENNTTGRGSAVEQFAGEGKPESIDTGTGNGIDINAQGSEPIGEPRGSQTGSGLKPAGASHAELATYLQKITTTQEYKNYLKINNGDENRALARVVEDRLSNGQMPKDIMQAIYQNTPVVQDMETGERLDPMDSMRGEHVRQLMENLGVDIGEPEGQPGSPVTLHAEVVPGLSKFFEHDVIPTVSMLNEAGHQVQDVINPPRATKEANTASNIVREALAKIENYSSIVHGKNTDFLKFFGKYSDEQNIANISQYERTGKFAKEPVTKQGQPSYSQLYHDSLVDSYRMIQEAYGRDTEGFIENYVRRAFVFDSPAEEQKGVNALTNFARSMSGSKSPLKQRVLDMPLDEAFKDMQERGIKVKMQTTNPEELRQWSLVNAKRLVVFKQTWNDLKQSGLIKFVRKGGQIPEGMVSLNDRAAEVFAPAEVRYGIPPATENAEGYQTALSVGKYYADPTVARILNNVIARGLEGMKVFQAARFLGNQMNSFQLGFSAFHLTGSALNAGFSDVALGLRDYIKGRPISGTVKAIRGLVPGVSFARDLYHGREFLQQLMNDDPVAKEYLENVLNPAGGRTIRDKQYMNNMTDQVKKMLANGNVIGATLRLPSALVETVAHPLLNYAIPRVKIGAFMDLAASKLERLPINATVDQRRTALASAWNSIDNRFGQLVYDNLFWNKVGKDLAMLSTRSVGWNLGDVRELGAGMVVDPIKTMLGGKERVNNNFGERFSDRMLFSLALILGTATISAIYQYLHTNHGPQELKDYFFPKDGGVDTAGNPTRRSMPTYWKDVYAFSNNPLATIGNKMSPGLATLLQLWQNKDYYGNLIRNPNDPAGTQLAQAGSYLLANILPFAIQGATQPGQTTEQKAEGFFGITKAPARIIQSPQQQAAQVAYQNQVGLPAPKTPEQVTAANLKTKAYAEIKANGAANSPSYKALIANGTLNTPLKQKLFIKNAGLTSLQRMGSHLSRDQRAKLGIKEPPPKKRGGGKKAAYNPGPAYKP